MATIASRLYSRLTNERLPRVTVATRPQAVPDTLHLVFLFVLAGAVILIALMGLVGQVPGWLGESAIVG